jgi:Na+(H+)/acetate symporter ActP
MLSSITPLGERGRGNRWGTTVAWFVAGSTVGGAALGAALGLAGEGVERLVPLRGRLVVIAVLAVAALAVDAARRPGLLPSWRRQVDERWMDEYRAWVYGAGWGAQLGTGVLTIVSSAGTYLVAALAALLGSFSAAVAIAATFGLTRGLTLLTARRLTTPAALHTFHQNLQPRRRVATAAVLAAEALVAAAAVAALLT